MTTVAPVALFQRAYRLVVGTLEIKTTPQQPSLNIAFSVKKSLKPEPNKAEIKIWNLNPDRRNALAQMQVVPVSLEAGYEGTGGTSLVFLGNLRTAFTPQDGADLITTITSGDKEQALRAAHSQHSFAKGTADIGTIFRLLAADLGVSEGNVSQAAAAIAASPLKSLVTRGFVLSGASSSEMTDLCRSVGYVWSVQDGALQLQPLARALSGVAIDIGPTTGMLGSPTVDNKGLLNVKTLLIPDCFPGRLMKLTSQNLSGNYRIEDTVHAGEMQGGEWGIDIKARRY